MGIFRSQKSYSAYATAHTKIIIISPKATKSKQNYFNFNWTFWGSESRYGRDRKSWNIRFYRIFCGFVVNGSWSNLWNGVGESRQSNVIHSSSENRDDTVLDLAEIYLTFSIIYSFNIQWISIGPEKPGPLGYFIYD